MTLHDLCLNAWAKKENKKYGEILPHLAIPNLLGEGIISTEKQKKKPENKDFSSKISPYLKKFSKSKMKKKSSYM